MQRAFPAGTTKVLPEKGPLTIKIPAPAAAFSVPIAPVSTVVPVPQLAPVPNSNCMDEAVVALLLIVNVHSQRKICLPAESATICVVVAVVMLTVAFDGARLLAAHASA